MFKDSKATRLTPWTLVEESEGLPEINLPAFVGSGKLGVTLDAAGFQSLSDRAGKFYGCSYAPAAVCQADTYVLHTRAVSAHLHQDEIKHTGKSFGPTVSQLACDRNRMPMGYLDQRFEWNGRDVEGDAVFGLARSWRRDWDLHRAVVRNRIVLDRDVPVETEVFAPHNGETVYARITRGMGKHYRPMSSMEALAAKDGLQKTPYEFEWAVELKLQTRHGLELFDQPGAVTVGKRTIAASITQASRYKPTEAYTVVYGVAAEGAMVELTPAGWRVVLRGTVDQVQTAWIRMDFMLLAGDKIAGGADTVAALERDLAGFGNAAYGQAFLSHTSDYKKFWDHTADVEIDSADLTEIKRQYLLHMSEYLLRCGDNYGDGGTPQFLFQHMNGWGASSFHDHHYVLDGAAKANIWEQAENHAHWLRKIMRPTGRAFPWMMTYTGEATVPPEQDRAPMSDANRAMTAIRVYEFAGAGRRELLGDMTYPIVRRVSDMALDDWFEPDKTGRLILRGVESDVTDDPAHGHDAGTVMPFLSVLTMAARYAAMLDVDADRAARWRAAISKISIEVMEGRYRGSLGAKPDDKANVWFNCSYYIAEAREFLDDVVYARTVDYGHRYVDCVVAWMGSSAACSEIRLGRADRAEQYLTDIIECRAHGPGYFEENVPAGLAALPPFATAHGSFITAVLEQIVLSDLWRSRVYVGRGMPSKLRAARVAFHHLRARDGLIVSGSSEPRRLTVRLHHTGDPVEMEVVLRVPCGVSNYFRVTRDGRDAPHDLTDEAVSMRVGLKTGDVTELTVEG